MDTEKLNDLEKRIQEIEKEIGDSGFRKWRSFDSVTDQYSPITGASQKIGFFGTPKITKPTVTGSKGANAALASLLTALSNLGLLTDSSS
jgi:hypothetical protein